MLTGLTDVYDITAMNLSEPRPRRVDNRSTTSLEIRGSGFANEEITVCRCGRDDSHGSAIGERVRPTLHERPMSYLRKDGTSNSSSSSSSEAKMSTPASRCAGRESSAGSSPRRSLSGLSSS